MKALGGTTKTGWSSIYSKRGFSRVLIFCLLWVGLAALSDAEPVQPVSVVNILVLYTPQASAGAGGANSMRTQINVAMQEANTVFQNSHINTRVHLALATQINYLESGTVSNDLARLVNPGNGILAQAHQLRDQVGADLVCLVTETGSDWSFYGLQGPSAANAFSVIRRPYLTGGYYFPVDLSFNFGCQLEPPYADSVGAFPYAYGYSFWANGTFYSTAEAFSGQRIPYFSNPDVLFQGVPMGVPTGLVNAADNALVMNQTAPIVAAFRSSSPLTLPPNISLSAPSETELFRSGTNITLSANATDPDGKVVRVDYYAGTNWLGFASTPPFKVQWNNVPVGKYSLVAMATDNAGAATISAAIQFTVVPTNNDFVARSRITGTASIIKADNTLASAELGEPDHAGFPAAHSLWWIYTAPANGVVLLNASASSIDASLDVYTGTALNALTGVASTSGSTESAVRFQVAAGRPYQIALDSPDGGTGAIQLDLNFMPLPANDNFAHRQQLSGNEFKLQANNRGATREAGEPNHTGTPGCASLWWSWTAPMNGEITFTLTSPTGASLLLGVYTGNVLTNLTPVSTQFQYPAAYLVTVEKGVTYQIAVDSPIDPLQPGPFEFDVNFSPEPVNDNFAGRTTISGTDISLTNSSLLAVTAPGTTYPYFPTLWWSWTAPATGYVTVGGPSSEYMYVYTGTNVTNLALVASQWPAVSFEAIAGTTYVIAGNGPAGQIEINLMLSTVRIVTPADGAILFNSNNVVLSATSTQIDGPLRQIQYFCDGSLIGTATQAPYIVVWPRVPLGSHALTVVGTDYYGRARSAPPINVTVQFPPPPNDNFEHRTTISGSLVTLTNSILMATLEPGEQNHGGTGLPSIWWSWTAPDSGTVMVTAGIQDYLDVYLGTTLTHLTPVANGSPVAFTATAGTTYAIAASGSPVGDVTLSLILYSLQLASPTNGQRYSVGSNIQLAVVPPTNHTSITRVEFFVNGRSLGVVAKAPFSLVWTNPPSGVYAITAVASDNLNHIRRSPANVVRVTPPNDDFANRLVVTGSTFSLTNTLAGATLQPGESALMGSDSNSVWWSWTAPISGLVSLSFPNGQDFGVFQGGSVSNLTQIVAGTGAGSFAATQGITYSISAAGAPDLVVFKLVLSTLQITNPPNGVQIIGGRNLEIDVSSTAFDGALQQVEVFASGISLGMANIEPFSLVWSNVPPGNYQLTAVGTNIAGIVHTSSVVPISVVPTNDFFANRITLNGSGAFVNGNVAYATREPGDPGLFNNTIWYSWTTPWTGDFVLSMNYNYWPTLDALVYSGVNIESLNFVTFGNAGSVKMIHVAAGTAYQICVASPDDAPFNGEIIDPFSNFTLNLQPCPSNDNFNNRITITNLSVPILANNLGATAEPAELNGIVIVPWDGIHSVWWTWTAPDTGWMTMSGSPTGYSPELFFYTGSAISNLVNVPDISTYGYSGLSQTYQVTGGTTYQIKADGNWSPDWSISFNLAFAPAPGNDNFANAVALSGTNFATTGDNSAATSEPGEANRSALPVGHSVWYSWTASSGGLATVVATGTNFSPVVNVLTGGSVAALTALGIHNSQGSVTFNCTAGTTYEIAVDGTGGAFTLNLTLVPPPGNDDFASRFLLSGLNPAVQGTTYLASFQSGEPSFSPWVVSSSVWYSWVAPANGTVRVHCPTKPVAIYTGDNVSNLTVVVPVNPTSFADLVFTATAGTEYEIAVAGAWWLPDSFTLSLMMPKAQFASPTNGDVFPWPANFEILARTIDSDGAVVRVNFFDGTNLLGTATNPPFHMDFLNAAIGSHELSLQSTDVHGLVTGGEPIEVRVEPINDNFSQSIIITNSTATWVADNSGATAEPGEYLPGGASGRTLWWTWTAPATGVVTIATSAFSPTAIAVTPNAVHFPEGSRAKTAATQPASVIVIGPGFGNPPGPSTGTLIDVYTGSSVTNLSLYASNVTWFSSWFIAGGWCVLPSISFPVVGGQTYQISFDGVNQSFGSGTFSFSFGPPPVPPLPPVNDNFAQATILPGSSPTITGTTIGATSEPGEPFPGADPATKTVWYSWTAPASGNVSLTAANSSSDLNIAVYAGSSLWKLIPVTQGVNQASYYALAGTTYKIVLACPSGLATDFSLMLNGPPPPPAITATRLLGGGYQLLVTGTVGQSFIVQASSDSVNWVTIRTDTLLGGSLSFVDAAAGLHQRFYQLLSLDAEFNFQPFMILAPSFQPGSGFNLHLAGVAGQPFRLQVSTNFLDWSDLSSGVLANETFNFTDQDAPVFSSRFYRALKQ